VNEEGARCETVSNDGLFLGVPVLGRGRERPARKPGTRENRKEIKASSFESLEGDMIRMPKGKRDRPIF